MINIRSKFNSPKFFAIFAVIAVLIVILIGIDFYQTAKQKEGLSKSQLLKAPKEKILKGGGNIRNLL